jgi:hypothetical protein
MTTTSALARRPIDNKKAKTERSGARTLVAIGASNKKMASSFTAENKDRDERGVAMWKTMLDKQDVKIGLEREKVEAAKIEA